MPPTSVGSTTARHGSRSPSNKLPRPTRTAAERWRQMNHNRAVAVKQATETLLQKPGRKRGLRRQDVEASFWVALDWGTYRTLTEQAHLTPTQYEGWLRNYYKATFLEP